MIFCPSLLPPQAFTKIKFYMNFIRQKIHQWFTNYFWQIHSKLTNRRVTLWTTFVKDWLIGIFKYLCTMHAYPIQRYNVESILIHYFTPQLGRQRCTSMKTSFVADWLMGIFDVDSMSNEDDGCMRGGTRFCIMHWHEAVLTSATLLTGLRMVPYWCKDFICVTSIFGRMPFITVPYWSSSSSVQFWSGLFPDNGDGRIYLTLGTKIVAIVRI